MVRILGACALFVLAAAATGAKATEAAIGGVSISLPPPAGFCELSATNPADSHVVTTISGMVAQGGNALLGMSADCQELAEWRAGKRPLLDDYGQYQTMTGLEDQLVASPNAAIQQTCASLRAQGNEMVSNNTPNVKSIIEGALKNVKMNSVTFAGVFAEDQMGCYAGEIQNLHAANGTEKTQLILIAVTVVKNKYIYVYRMAVYTSSDIVTALLRELKNTVAALYAANP
jgi:hypothetical protein